MARDAATIRDELEKLRGTRATGANRIRFADREVFYRTDAELRNAIAALEAELKQATGSVSPRNVIIRTAPAKGW